jgi:hypothetical protein
MDNNHVYTVLQWKWQNRAPDGSITYEYTLHLNFEKAKAYFIREVVDKPQHNHHAQELPHTVAVSKTVFDYLQTHDGMRITEPLPKLKDTLKQ